MIFCNKGFCARPEICCCLASPKRTLRPGNCKRVSAFGCNLKASPDAHAILQLPHHPKLGCGFLHAREIRDPALELGMVGYASACSISAETRNSCWLVAVELQLVAVSFCAFRSLLWPSGEVQFLHQIFRSFITFSLSASAPRIDGHGVPAQESRGHTPAKVDVVGLDMAWPFRAVPFRCRLRSVHRMLVANVYPKPYDCRKVAPGVEMCKPSLIDEKICDSLPQVDR